MKADDLDKSLPELMRMENDLTVYTANVSQSRTRDERECLFQSHSLLFPLVIPNDYGNPMIVI